MKFNWGTGIFIFYSIFATSLFYQVYKSTQYDHSLVVDNYYEKDLAYQAQYDKIVNSKALKIPLEINYQKEIQLIEIVFPKEIKGISGKVLFFRAADQSMDVLLPIALDNENKMTLQSNKFPSGHWRVEVAWKAADKAYFDETRLNILDSPREKNHFKLKI